MLEIFLSAERFFSWQFML